MLAREIMSRDVVTCHPAESLADAVCRMWDHDCGALPVVDDRGAVVGMITDRDIAVACWSHGQAPEKVRVAEAMSSTVISCEPDASVETIELRMRQHQIRRLPVLDGEGRIAGIVTIADLARAIDRHEPDESEEIARTLAAISARRLRAGEAMVAGETTYHVPEHLH